MSEVLRKFHRFEYYGLTLTVETFPCLIFVVTASISLSALLLKLGSKLSDILLRPARPTRRENRNN